MSKLAWGMLLMTVTACNRPPPTDAVDQANPLEATARARGLVRDKETSLTGVFERRHELGRDLLCVVPGGKGHWRFALSESFGPSLSCRARGTITAAGEGWRFDFEGVDGCAPVLNEKGDELQFPGNLPDACDALCPGRASLAGLRLPRASWSEADARRLRFTDDHGMRVQPCSD